MLARLWQSGDAVLSSEVPIFFRLADKAAATAAVIGSGYLPRAFAITPNGEAFLEFAWPYVEWKCRRDARALLSADYSGCALPVRELLTLYAEICQALNDHAAEALWVACDELRRLLAALPISAASTIPPKLAAACDALARFSVECLRPIETGPPFTHSGTAMTHRSWWGAQAGHVSVLQQFKRRLASDFSSIPGGLSPMVAWVDVMEARVRKLHALPPSPLNKVLAIQEGSAFCAAMAERHLLRGQNGLAVLLLHRSADLLLFSLSAKHGAIDFTAYGGRYLPPFAPGKGSNRITLLNSLTAINSLLAANPKRKSDFEHLNDWRNLLMQAHYMTGLDDTRALDLFVKIRPHLESLSDADWKVSRKEYLEGPKVSLGDLIDIDGSLSSGVAEVFY